MILLLTFILLPSVRCEFSTDMMIDVTFQVINNFRSTCVYLLKSTQGSVNEREIVVISILSKKYITTSLIMFHDVTKVLKNSNCRPLFILFNKYIQELKKFSEMFNLSIGKWLIFEDSDIPPEVLFGDINIPIDCEFILAKHTSHKTITLTAIYRVHSSKPLQTYIISNLTSGAQAVWTRTNLFQQRDDFQGINLKAVFIPFSNFLAGSKYPKDKPIERDGFIYQTWDPLQKKLNFTTEFTIPQDGALGSKLKNGSWNGLMQMIASRSAEVIAFLLAMTETRMEVVDYLTPILHSKFSVFIKKPDTTDHTLKSVLKPFSSSLWLALIASIVILSLIFTATWYTEYQSGFQEAEEYNIWNSTFYMTVSFFQQGQDTTPKTWPCRLPYITAYITALIVMVAYSAVFISFLTVRKFELPFKDFEGFLENKNYELGVLEKSATLNIFSSSGNKILKDIYRQFIFNARNPPKSLMEGMRRVCAYNRYAFINLKLMAMLHRRYLDCQVVEIPHASFPVPLAMAVNKENPYKGFFNYYFIKMQEAGILAKNGENIIPLKFREYDEEEIPESVSVNKTIPLFVIFLIGVLLAIVSLIIEIILHKSMCIFCKQVS